MDSSPIFVKGGNFSGRSDLLKSLSQEYIGVQAKFLYIGEQPQNYLSGLFSTVSDEILFHRAAAIGDTPPIIKELFDSFGFARHFAQNPFTLSGGEQTILVVLTGLLLPALKNWP